MDTLGPLYIFVLATYIVVWLTVIGMYVLPFVGIVLIIRDIKKKKFTILTAIILGLNILFVIPYFLVVVMGWHG